MRHKKSFNHLSRKSAHRKSMLANMASSLIKHKRIETTTAKAKALRRYVEPLITRSKDDTTHSRRVVFSYLQDKDAVTELFREVGAKVADRPGGYTRIIKLGHRQGDNADMCLIELVDYNENLLAEKAAAKKSGSRRRRGRKTSATAAAADSQKSEGATEGVEPAKTPEADPKSKTESGEAEVAEAAPEAVEEVKEEAVEAETEEVVEEAAAEEKAEDATEEVKVEAAEAKAEEVVEEAATEEKAEEVPEEKTEDAPEAKKEDAPEAREEEKKEEEKKDEDKEDKKD